MYIRDLNGSLCNKLYNDSLLPFEHSKLSEALNCTRKQKQIKQKLRSLHYFICDYL